MPFTAIMNTPGYSPWSDDEPPVFKTAAEAWEYLADERERQEDGTDALEYTETLDKLRTYQNAEHGADVLYGDTPGYDGEHDLGIAYNVIELPIEATRCPCCGDDVMDVPGLACSDCRTAGCERSHTVEGPAYTNCQNSD